jgi:hypothetical protein
MDGQLAAIREVERTLDLSVTSACIKPPAPSSASGIPCPARGVGNFYGDPTRGATDDAANLATVARNHWAVIKAAFICDLTRVATFQLEPGTGHVGFRLFPNSNSVYRHHPESHRADAATMDLATPPSPVPDPIEFLIRVEEWYNTLLAELVADLRATTDPLGNNLLGTTVVPYVTEVRNAGHARSGMPGVIFGGRDLGMQGNLFRQGNFTINSFWGTIGQAFNLPSAAPLAAPISGLWLPPPP